MYTCIPVDEMELRGVSEMNKCVCNVTVPRFWPLLQIVRRDHHPIKAMKSLCVQN